MQVWKVRYEVCDVKRVKLVRGCVSFQVGFELIGSTFFW
jgi:hypothetical protein